MYDYRAWTMPHILSRCETAISGTKDSHRQTQGTSVDLFALRLGLYSLLSVVFTTKGRKEKSANKVSLEPFLISGPEIGRFGIMVALDMTSY
jgi:hypothetical protein